MTDKPQEFTDFQIDYYNEVNEDPLLYDEIDRRLRKLARDNTDITGAAANIRQPDQANATEIEATVVVYSRPTHISATAHARQPQAAVKGALDAIERQLREKREKLRGY
jgi:ribosome-associated translation inhibitor RaiA